jgi:hypothetical protein
MSQGHPPKQREVEVTDVDEVNEDKGVKQTTSGQKGATYIDYKKSEVAAALKEAIQ